MTPPRLAAWLIGLAAARAQRADVLADLADEARSVAAASGNAAARRWYWAQARRSFGPLLAARWAAISGPSVGAVGRDVTLAVRSLRAAPAFTLSVVLLLGLGVGATVVAYAVVDGLALRPLPFGERNDRLVTLHSTHPAQAPDWDDSLISYADLSDVRRRSTTLAAVEGLITRNVAVSTGADTERVAAASVTPGLFDLLGVTPARGRAFSATDAAEIGHETSVIVSDALWRTMLGADPAAVGRTLLINGRALTLVGVMPADFAFPEDERLWLPYRAADDATRDQRGLLGLGLLQAGATRDQAEQEVQSIAATLAADYPATNARWSLHLLSLRDFLVSGGDAEMLFTAVSLVLLVIAANVSSLLIARGLTRAPELSLRAALGAGRARLARLLTVEVGVLAVAGGTIGLVVANWGIRAINVWIPEPPPFWARPAIDVRTAAAAFAITTVVALAAGLWPVLRLSRANSGSVLSGTRVTAAPSHRRMQRVLVCGQVAVTFALLIGATLLNRSATSLLTADGGFDMARLSSFRFYIAGDAYDEPGRRARAVDNVVQRIAALPGVEAAGATGAIPTDDGGDGIRIATPDSVADRDLAIGGQLVPAGASFWNAIGRRVITGRVFTAAEDVDPEAHVAIVNERLAARLWPGDSAVDRVLRLDGNYGGEYRVVGVAPNLVYEEFGEETGPAELIVYVPLATSGWRTNAVLARTAGDPSLLLGRVRDAVRQVDPGFAVYDERTMPARRRYNHWGSVFLGHAGVTFAWVALLLACVGAYGLAAHGVNERRREIGVRLALGASRRAVVQLFVGLGVRLALAGVAVGVVLGLGVARALAHGDELFRTSPWALDVWIGPPLILAAAVVAACFVPARRAARIDPATTLRAD